jgi:aconitate hydratase
VKAVIAKSFERIHAANLVNFGILPLTFRDPVDYDSIEAGDVLRVPKLREALRPGAPLAVENVTRKRTFEVDHNLDGRRLAIVAAGGLLSYYRTAQA